MSMEPSPASAAATPWLSVLVPFFNVREYLDECLSSIAAQADEGVEIIAFNDGSTDGSCEIAGHFAGSVTVLGGAANGGVSRARNALIDHARGRHVWFVDSDDVLMPGAIAGLRKIVDQHDPDLVLCDYSRLRPKLRLRHRLRGDLHVSSFRGVSREVLCDRSIMLEGLFRAASLHPWTRISKRSLWAGDLRFPPDRSFEDVAVMPRLFLRVDRAYHEPSVWVAHRVGRAGSIVATPSLRKAGDLVHALDGQIDDAQAQLVLSASARYAWSVYAAQNFITAARTAAAYPLAESAACMRDLALAFERQIPLGLRELFVAMVRHGKPKLALQTAYWVRRARRAATLTSASFPASEPRA